MYISLNFIHKQSPFTLDYWNKIKVETSRDTILAKILNAVLQFLKENVIVIFSNNLELFFPVRTDSRGGQFGT